MSLTRAQRRGALDVLTRAFIDHPHYAMFDARTRERSVRRLMEVQLLGWSSEDEIDVVEENGRVISVMIRFRPGRVLPTFSRLLRILAATLRPSFPRRAELGAHMRARERFASEARLRARHWYVRILAVAPEHQRKGVGRRLMELAVARADHDRFPIQLFALERVCAFYERLGFEKKIVHEDDRFPPVYAMIRWPGGRAPSPSPAEEVPVSTEWRTRMPGLFGALRAHPPPRPLGRLFFAQTEMSGAHLALGTFFLALIAGGVVLANPRLWSGIIAIAVLALTISATLFRRASQYRHAALVQGALEGTIEGRNGYLGNVVVTSGVERARIVVEIDRELMSGLSGDHARLEVVAMNRPGAIAKALAVRCIPRGD